MISADLRDLIILAMVPGLVTISACWIWSAGRDLRRERHWRRMVVRCRLCNHRYLLQDSKAEISYCPECGSANEREPEASL